MENNPERFSRISDSQLSIARHFGGCKYNGMFYVYDPADDTLTRQDVWKEDMKAKMNELRSVKAEKKQEQNRKQPKVSDLF